MRKFDPKIPRRVYWAAEVADPTVCPQCGARLEPDHQSYQFFIRTRGKKDVRAYVAGHNDGMFCRTCPVVVLDPEALAEMAGLVSERRGDTEIMVLGIVDLDAVPEDKRHLPLGSDENPFPVVEFLNYTERKAAGERRPAPSAGPPVPAALPVPGSAAVPNRPRRRRRRRR